jgi:hypothetical protein
VRRGIWFVFVAGRISFLQRRIIFVRLVVVVVVAFFFFFFFFLFFFFFAFFVLLIHGQHREGAAQSL